MNNKPFTKIGPQSRKEIVLGLLRTKHPGDVVTYEELGAELQDNRRQIAQSSVNQAQKKLLQEDSIAIEAVKNIGYRIVQADEHSKLATRHHTRSIRQVKKGLALVQHVDFGSMTQEGREIAMRQNAMFCVQLEIARRHEKHLRDHDFAIESISSTQHEAREDIDDLRRRLTEIERNQHDSH